MRVLLLIPPMTQLNTPYPATAYLTGFLRQEKVDAVQADPAIELILRLFSQSGLERMAEELRDKASRETRKPPRSVANFLKRTDHYLRTVDSAIRFLQGKDPSLALRIVSRGFLPEGPRFDALKTEDG